MAGESKIITVKPGLELALEVRRTGNGVFHQARFRNTHNGQMQRVKNTQRIYGIKSPYDFHNREAAQKAALSSAVYNEMLADWVELHINGVL